MNRFSVPVRRLFQGAVLGSVLCAVFLSACDKTTEQIVLPKGVQTLTGALLPTELSLLRRGTHLLQIGGKDTYYVESNRVNLRRYEGKNVVLEGTLELNVDPTFLPVLTVDRVVEVLEETLKEWKLPSLGLILPIPDTWNGTASGTGMIFTIPGTVDPVLHVYEQTAVEIAGGTPVVIDRERAIRVIQETTGVQTIYVPRGDKQLVLVFDPSPSDRPDALREAWLTTLQAIKLNTLDVSDSSSSPTSGSGTSTGTACGGTAGILCPQGFYCNVTNLQENIGFCQKY